MKLNPKAAVYVLTIAVVLVSWLFAQIPFVISAGQLFTDQLQSLPASSQIVIVGIDDKSLQTLGAWEWSRDLFAQTLEKIESGKPSAVALDVLFLESRTGDDKLEKVINEATIPMVFASKLVDGEIISPKFTKAKSGFINFLTEADGKIRQNLAYTSIGDDCYPSFALTLARAHLRVNSKDACENPIVLRNKRVNLNDSNTWNFSYSRERFTKVSFSDVYSGAVAPETFKDKIVLIGATAIDLRSGLNDNFFNVFGQSIPGVEVHANVVNSLLQGFSLQTVPTLLALGLMLVTNLTLVFLYQKLKRRWLDAVLVGLSLGIFTLVGIILFNFGQVWPFVFTWSSLIGTFAAYILYSYYNKRRESDFVRKAFGQYVNPAILHELLGEPGKLQLGGENREMSVMFSDVRGFTSLSETLTPHELISLLNKYLDMMSEIIIRRQGTIDKYIGDAIMALWNAPLKDEKHADNSIDTAIAMEKALIEFNKTSGFPELKIGIGINTGDMVVGNVGGSLRFDYTVLGDNVNLASRLEGLTKKYGISTIVTEATMNACLDLEKYIFRQLDETQVKGKSQAIKIYQPMEKTSENEKTAKAYAAAFAQYQSGNFAEAAKLLIKFNPKKDAPAQMLLARCEEFTKHPPADWHGVWKWDEK